MNKISDDLIYAEKNKAQYGIKRGMLESLVF